MEEKINQYVIQAINNLIDNRMNKLKYDKSFVSVVENINSNGTYQIQKDNQKFNVKCVLPVALTVGQAVWVKIPCGDMNGMHIYGIAK